jgi:hypothetical protein
MTPGRLLYRCRACGTLDRSVHVPDLVRALALLALGKPLPRSWGVVPHALHDLHVCSGGSLGVADLIGGDPDTRGVPKPEPTAATRAKLEGD